MEMPFISSSGPQKNGYFCNVCSGRKVALNSVVFYTKHNIIHNSIESKELSGWHANSMGIVLLIQLFTLWPPGSSIMNTDIQIDLKNKQIFFTGDK